MNKMKNLLLVSFLLLIGFKGFGQEEDAPADDFKKIRIGINITPEYCYRRLNNNGGGFGSNLLISSRNDLEIPKSGFSCGLEMEYAFSKKMSITGGALFSDKGYKTETMGLTYGNVNDPRLVFVANDPNDPALPNEASFIYNFYYLDVPLKAVYKVGNGKFKMRATLGFYVNVFLKATETTVLVSQSGSESKSTQGSWESFNHVNISPTIGIGVEKQMGDKHFLIIEPCFQYGVLKIIDTPVTGHLWSFGVKLGYQFGLK